MGVLVELLLLLHVEIFEAPEVKLVVLTTDQTFPVHNSIQQECQMQHYTTFYKLNLLIG